MGKQHASLNWLSTLPDWERGDEMVHSGRMTPEPLRCFLSTLDLFPLPFCVVQVVGSKGKGSVSMMLERLALGHHLKTGIYTSPDLISRRERIRIDGVSVGEELWLSAATKCFEKSLLDPSFALSRFEVETAMALLCFVHEQVEFIVLEAGLGGQTDATSAIPASIIALTSVELEHTALLGDSTKEITWQKIGMAKKGTAIVVGPIPQEAMQVVRNLTRERQVSLLEVGREVSVERLSPRVDGLDVQLQVGIRHRRTSLSLQIPVFGLHQAYMLAVAVAVMKTWCERTGRAWFLGACGALAGLHLPARLQRLSSSPLLVLDTAHTPHSVAAALEAYQAHWRVEPGVILCAFHKDKQLDEMIKMLGKNSVQIFLSSVQHPRSASPALLKKFVPPGVVDVIQCEDVKGAWEPFLSAVRSGKPGLIIGSFLLARTILQLLEESDFSLLCDDKGKE